MASEPYYKGRSDYKTGVCVPPKEYTSTEKMQWDSGWRDEHLRNPDPIHASELRSLANSILEGRSPTRDDAEMLIEIAEDMQRRHK